MPDSTAASTDEQRSDSAAPRFDIRPASFDEPPVTAMTTAVQEYYRLLYKSPDSAPVDNGEFTPPRGMFFVGFEDDQPVAMGGWRWIDPLPEMPAERPVEIKRMYVDAAVRGRGYARLVLSELEETARAAGADTIVLSTGQPQVEAIALYRSAGYVDAPRFGYYAPYPTAVHLGKPLL